MLDKIKYVYYASRYGVRSINPVIEQTPRKRTIFTSNHPYGKDKRTYYLAFPYMILVPSIIDFQRHVYIQFRIAMCKTLFNGEESLYALPLPNGGGFSPCGTQGLDSSIAIKKDDSVSNAIKLISKKSDEVIASFWNSNFISHSLSDCYSDNRQHLMDWEKLSKTDNMAAFKINKRSELTSVPYDVLPTKNNIKPPEDFPEMLEKYLRLY